MRKKSVYIASGLFACILVYLVCYLNRSWTDDEVERAKVDVTQRSCFALLADGQEVAYFSSFQPEDSSFVCFTTSRDSAMICTEGVGVWVNSTSFFPSAFGCIMAVDEQAGMEAQAKMMMTALDSIAALNLRRMQRQHQRNASVMHEVDYYLRHHSIFDNEYIGVANYAYQLKTEGDHLASMIRLLEKHLSAGRKLQVKVLKEYSLQSLPLHIAPSGLRTPSLQHMKTGCGDYRFVALCNDTLTSIPDSCLALSTPLFLDTDLSDLVYEWNVKLHHLNYHSPLVEGSGLTSLELYRFIQRDTLFDGASVDTAHNAYRGQMTEEGLPQGYGIMRYANGDYYEGEWHQGARHGHGFYVADGQLVKAGEWGDDRFLGEKMNYTDNRVYGIDISRYQHEIGHRLYPINWKQLRITSLGTRNSALVNGPIDFPVSFVYIKSTQGTTIKSAYYQQDAHAARRQGILCGAYHFFSLHTSGKDQAQYFLDNTEILSSDMPPVLDVEPTDEAIEQAGGEARLFANMRDWLTLVERATGKRPILYISQMFVKTHLLHAPDLCQTYPVWIARYNVYRPDVKLLFWQLCCDGRVSGIHGTVDINIFNGYQEQFDEYAAHLRTR
jgi:lysozyme